MKFLFFSHMHKSLQKRPMLFMLTYLVGLIICSVHYALCMQAAQALHMCAGLPESLFLENVVSTNISCVGSRI